VEQTGGAVIFDHDDTPRCRPYVERKTLCTAITVVVFLLDLCQSSIAIQQHIFIGQRRPAAPTIPIVLTDNHRFNVFTVFRFSLFKPFTQISHNDSPPCYAPCHSTATTTRPNDSPLAVTPSITSRYT